MVHALEITHDFLKSDGALINIQPVGKPRPLEIHSPGVVVRVGWIGQGLNFALHKAALDAVAQAVHDGMFVIEKERKLPFLYHAGSFSLLREWLAENMTNATLDEATARRAQELSSRAQDDSEAIMREEIVISLLKPASLLKPNQKRPGRRRAKIARRLLGLPVVRIIRVRIGSRQLDNLKRGE